MSSLDNYETEDKPMQCDKIENKPVQQEDVKQGEYLNRVIHGDCLEVMQKIEPNSIDMVLTDLPYGNPRNTDLKWDKQIDLKQMWDVLNRVCKQGYVGVFCADQPFTSILVNSNLKNFKFEWIWRKDKTIGFTQCNYRPMKCTEDILVFSEKNASNSAKDPLTYNPQGLKLANVVKTNKADRLGVLGKESTGIGNDNVLNSDKKYVQKYTNYPNEVLEFSLDKKQHPTQKPVKLFEYLIKTHSNEGDTILDCCAGSGTTGIACKNTGRNYILIEKEQEYIDVIHKRGL